MTPDVPGNFPTAGGVAHMDRVLQIELLGEGRKIVSVGVHVIAVPGLCRTTMSSPIVRDDSISPLPEIQHLSIPVIRAQRPAVTEDDGLAFAPIFVVDAGAVFGGDCRHGVLSLSFRI